MTNTLTVTSGQQQLAVTVRGAANQPTIVLVHGYPDTSTVWDAVADELSQDYFVVTYDVRGTGASSIPRANGGYLLECFVEDLEAVINAASPDKPVHLVGHDWGSIHSWESVTTERLKGRIASFTSISGPCLDHVGHWIRERLRHPSLTGWRQVFGQLLRSWYVLAFHLPAFKYVWKLGLSRVWPRLLRLSEGTRVRVSPTQVSDGFHGMAMYRANFFARVLRPRERHAHAPVLMLAPTRDYFVSPALSEDLQRWVPQLWRREVDAGHWLPLKHPQLVARHVREFVQAIETGTETGALRRARVNGTRQPDSGKLVVVTGAGSGIGRSTALAFAERGAVLVAADINLAAAERTAVLARLLGTEAHARAVDVGDVNAMEAFAGWVLETQGTPDVVINNAGIGMAGGLLQTTVADWERIMRVNLWGVIHGSRLFGRQMAEQHNSGHIVNVASAAAFAPSRSYPAYATTKAATLMLTECLRAEMAGYGIGVSAVCPGFVETGIATATRYVGISEAEENRRRQKAAQLYHRRGFTPEMVATAILKAVRYNRPVALVGIEALSAQTMARLSPGLVRLFARIDLTPK